VRAILPCLAVLAMLAVPAAAQARESQFTIFEAPTELLSDDAALRAQTLDEIHGFGVHWLRVVLCRHSVAPVPDHPGVPRFDETDPSAYPGFGSYDRLIHEARARGMRILLTVSGPVPRWATRDRDVRGALCLDSGYHRRRGCKQMPADGWAHHAYMTAVGPFFARRAATT
jgi:hypothetical protein